MTGGRITATAGSDGTLRSWSRATAGCCAVVVAGLFGLDVLWSGGPGAGFLAGVAVVLALESIVLWTVLSRTDRRTNAAPLTAASWITIARAGAVAVLGGFLVAGPPSGTLTLAPAAYFAIAASLDAVDGRVARASGAVTEVGATLDREVDALVVFVGAAIVVAYGLAPVAYLLVGLARYLFGAGLWLRRRRGGTVRELPPRTSRRVLGASQLVVVWLVLLPVPGETASWWLAAVATVPFLLGFVRDWLLVTGRR